MTEINDKNYISRIVEALIFASSKPVSSKELLPYVGDFKTDEIIQVKDLFDGWEGNLIVLHCVSSYPCTSKNINFLCI